MAPWLQASTALEGLTGINLAQVFSNALDNANLTGSAEERAIRARNEPDTTAAVDVNVSTGDSDDVAPAEGEEEPTS